MDTLVHIGLLNAVLATGLAILAAAARVLRRRPAFVHALWLLVLLKLLTPPFLVIPISWLPRAEPESRVPEWTKQSSSIGRVVRGEPSCPFQPARVSQFRIGDFLRGIRARGRSLTRGGDIPKFFLGNDRGGDLAD